VCADNGVRLFPSVLARRRLVRRRDHAISAWAVMMVVERIDVTSTCPRCNAGAPQLYGLPEKVLYSLAEPRAACYFCYVRIVGIKPTRRKIVS